MSISKIKKIFKRIVPNSSWLYKQAVFVYSLLYVNVGRGVLNKIRIILKLSSPIDSIKKYKNIHEGERCFIVATGPSLSLEDIEIIKNEITFSMNSIIKMFPLTDWRPTYYGIQDMDVYRCLKHEFRKKDFKKTKVFYNSQIRNFFLNKAQPYFLDYLFHGIDMKGKPKYRFSFDIQKSLYDGHSISFSMLQIAVYMGFKEIYIIGLDAAYPKEGKMHFIDYGNFENARNSPQGQIEAFKYCKSILKEKKVYIYNATRGGALEVFPRVNLEDLYVLSNKE